VVRNTLLFVCTLHHTHQPLNLRQNAAPNSTYSGVTPSKEFFDDNTPLKVDLKPCNTHNLESPLGRLRTQDRFLEYHDHTHTLCHTLLEGQSRGHGLRRYRYKVKGLHCHPNMMSFHRDILVSTDMKFRAHVWNTRHSTNWITCSDFSTCVEPLI
jgi:hypothetical protein